METVERDVVERGGELGARRNPRRGVGDGSGGRVGVVRRGIGGGGDESLGVDVELAEGAVGGEDARGAPTKRATPAENLGRFRGGSSVARVGVGVGGGGGGGARANGNRGRDAPGTGASVDGRAMRATDARAREQIMRASNVAGDANMVAIVAAWRAVALAATLPRRRIRRSAETCVREGQNFPTRAIESASAPFDRARAGVVTPRRAHARHFGPRRRTEMKTRRSFLLLLLLALALVGPHATGGGFTAEAASSKERRRGVEMSKETENSLPGLEDDVEMRRALKCNGEPLRFPPRSRPRASLPPRETLLPSSFSAKLEEVADTSS